jgi:hypothetical protein
VSAGILAETGRGRRDSSDLDIVEIWTVFLAAVFFVERPDIISGLSAGSLYLLERKFVFADASKFASA